jgi:hypothetical protein
VFSTRFPEASSAETPHTNRGSRKHVIDALNNLFGWVAPQRNLQQLEQAGNGPGLCAERLDLGRLREQNGLML